MAERDQHRGGRVPGFITQSVLPPNPPLQVDWVIQQRFANVEAASAWLVERRTRLLDAGQPMLAGQDDVHLVRDSASGARPAPVSAVIPSRVRAGQEAAFRAWEHRIASAQARSPGFQGYRFEPPIPGVQEDWLAILRFDTERNLQAWLEFARAQTAAERGGAVSRGVSRPGGAHRLRAVVPVGGERTFAADGLEAEHDCPAAALSGGLPVRCMGADAGSDGKRRTAVLVHPVRRQCRQRATAQLASALGE